MNQVPEAVPRDVILELVGPHGYVQAEAELRYFSADPYDVTVEFLMRGAPVTWCSAAIC